MLSIVHFHSFIADEELGGHEGMAVYVVSKEFKDLNIGFTLDEGLASEDNAIPLFYGERNSFWVQFKCKGKTNICSRTKQFLLRDVIRSYNLTFFFVFFSRLSPYLMNY